MGKNKTRSLLILSLVPQGSVIGPTLFLLRIIDLLPSISNHILSYAIDSTLRSSVQYISRSTPNNPARPQSWVNVKLFITGFLSHFEL